MQLTRYSVGASNRTVQPLPIKTSCRTFRPTPALLLVTLGALSLLASAQASSVSSRGIGPRPLAKAFSRNLPRTQKKNSVDTQVDRVTKRLNLSEVQRLDLRKLLEHDHAESKLLWDDQQINPIDRMTRLRTLHDGTRSQFRALLTREQQAKYDAILQQNARVDAPPQQVQGTTQK